MEAGQEVADGLAANATQSTAELNTHESDPNAHHMPGGGGGGLQHVRKLDDQDTRRCTPMTFSPYGTSSDVRDGEGRHGNCPDIHAGGPCRWAADSLTMTRRP